jgi:hypothetical protein
MGELLVTEELDDPDERLEVEDVRLPVPELEVFRAETDDLAGAARSGERPRRASKLSTSAGAERVGLFG